MDGSIHNARVPRPIYLKKIFPHQNLLSLILPRMMKQKTKKNKKGTYSGTLKLTSGY